MVPDRSLAEVKAEFAKWRQERKKKTRTPDDLKDLAVQLQEKYPIAQISKELGINYTDLRKWGRDTHPHPHPLHNHAIQLQPDFAEIPVWTSSKLVSEQKAPERQELNLELISPTGVRLLARGCLPADYLRSLFEAFGVKGA